jgi:dUTP pyrophosphatase
MLPGEQVEIRPRSGLALHYTITVLNTPGTVDKDYEGKEIGVLLMNHGDEIFIVNIHDRIAQAVFMPFLVADDDQAEGERTGGFGSSGI